MKFLADSGGQSLGNISGSGLGPFGAKTYSSASQGITDIISIVSKVIGILTVVASVWFMFQILFAGYLWITAGGDAKKLAQARDQIIHAFVGLVIVVGAWSLTAVTGQFFGYNTLIDPGIFTNSLQIK